MSKQNPVFAMHGYHLGKKPVEALERHIRACTRAGEVVLDPFCGSGSTALAAARCGRRAIAVDASPGALWVAGFYTRAADATALERAWQDLLADAGPAIEALYVTKCHGCGGPARVEYSIYANVYPCAGCGRGVNLYEHSAGCPACAARVTTDLPIRGYEPVATCVRCLGTCRPPRRLRDRAGDARARAHFERDAAELDALDQTPPPCWTPDRAMLDVAAPSGPWGDEWAPSRDVRRVRDLFTPRNWHALSILWHHAGQRQGGRDDLRAIITAGMLAVSRKAQHLAGGGGYIPGHWALPPVSKQRNVLTSLNAVARKAIAAKRLLEGTFDPRAIDLREGSASDLSFLPDASVDYVLTDPPYGPLVQYAELNFLWEAWLDAPGAWREREIIVNRTRGRSEDDWAAMMLAAMRECRRVLKPGRWLSLCYHDTSPARWARVGAFMREAGFVMHPRPGSIDSGGRSYVMHTAGKPTRRELVWHFRVQEAKAGAMKPAMLKPGRALELEKVLARARRCFRAGFPGRPCPPIDRLYDAIITLALREGVLGELVRGERKLTRASFERSVRRWALHREPPTTSSPSPSPPPPPPPPRPSPRRTKAPCPPADA